MRDRARRVVQDQIVGVAAQVAFGAPALVASLVLARFAEIRLVADLAVAFGLTSTVFIAASFNLAQYLALWGERGFAIPVFWLNRLLSSLAGAVIALALLGWHGTDAHIAMLAVLLKFADASADLSFGLRLLHVEPGESMRGLLRWSALRLAIFCAGIAFGLWYGMGAVEALLLGGVLQFAVMMPWRTVSGERIGSSVVRSAVSLGRGAAHLAVAGTASGILVTTPRLLASSVVPAAELGYYGTIFIASTLIGMSFNVAWYRLAAATRDSDPLGAIRAFLVEGVVLGAFLVLGLWLSVPLVAVVFDVPGGEFGRVFVSVGSVLILLYFAMALANLLKTARLRLLEATAYVVTAAALYGAAMFTHSLTTGILVGAAVLVGFVIGGVRNVRRIVVG